jgi:twitching motility protein PilT
MECIADSTSLGRLLDWVHQQSASDLHLQDGKPPRYRLAGQLALVPESAPAAASGASLSKFLVEALSPELYHRIRDARELDFSVACGEARFRVNCSKQQGSQSASFRLVPRQTQALADLQLPAGLRELIEHLRGVVILTGPTGQGKSTTARALLQEINLTRACRIIAIEDPIEFVFEDRLAQFEQREVGVDTASFASGIRNAMRQDPNVIFVGEIRDAESIFAAMQAAETGHLVITTLHADGAAQAVGRILEYYPHDQRDAMRSLLGRNLKAVACQRLVPNVWGTRTPCLELLKRDAGVESAILSNNLTLLHGIMEASTQQGMHTFDQYLFELLAGRVITVETARQVAANRHKLDLMITGIRINQPILRPDAAT